MPNQLTDSPVTFHLSLNVGDLERSVAFFAKVFGTEPAKCRPDYAKFEVKNPPLTLSLEPHASGANAAGALNHAGFRLGSSEELVALQRRLEMAGLASQREEGVECCYARQTKFWLHDPDGNLWEFYVLTGDIEHRGAGQTEDAVRTVDRQNGNPQPITANAKWSHRLWQPPAVPSEFDEGSLDEVHFQGTFNGDGGAGYAADLLTRACRVLRPGGRLSVHCLTADRPVGGELRLPGPAEVVRSVPVDNELLRAIEDAGFVNVQLVKFGAAPCFRVGGVEMRETLIEALTPPANSSESDGSDETVCVVYKGPFRAVTLDQGGELRRGQRQNIPRSAWGELQTGPLADHVVELAETAGPVVCTAGP